MPDYLCKHTEKFLHLQQIRKDIRQVANVGQELEDESGMLLFSHEGTKTQRPARRTAGGEDEYELKNGVFSLVSMCHALKRL